MRAHTGISRLVSPAGFLTLVLLAALILSGCSVFNRQAPAPAGSEAAPEASEAAPEAAASEDAPALYTQAAETIMAELAQKAPATQAPAAPQPSNTPTEEPLPPTSTPRPTNTPLPSDTPLPSNTPLPTSTTTPQTPPTATLPPEPNWNLTLTDDFTNTYWPHDNMESVRFRYTMGGYTILNRSEQTIVWSARDDQYAGVRLEVKAQKIAGPLDGYYGVVCGFSNGGNYYFLGVGANGWYGIGLQLSNKLTWLIEGMDITGIIHTGNAPNVIRADCQNQSLTLWVNGTMLATVRDTTFSAGSVGMAVGNRNATGTEALFDDFSIYQVEATTP